MKVIQIKDMSYAVPESWEEVTVKMQVTVDQLAIEHPHFKSLAVIAGYCNIPFDDLRVMHVNDIKGLIQSISFIRQKRDSTPVTEFEYKGETYSVIQSLLKGEFQDFISLESTIEQHKNEPHKALSTVCAIMSKKKVYESGSNNFHFESLSDFDITNRAKHFEDLPITTAQGIQAFFLASAILYSRDSHKVLKGLDQNLNESLTNTLNILKEQSGGGLFTVCVRAILRSWIWFLKRSWKRYYSGYTSEKPKQNWIHRLLRFRTKK